MQPVSGYSWTRVQGTAAGTSVVGTVPMVLHGIVVGVNKTGTADFYDTNAATSASSLMFELQNTAGTTGIHMLPDIQCKKGLAVVTSGTTDFIVLTY